MTETRPCLVEAYSTWNSQATRQVTRRSSHGCSGASRVAQGDVLRLVDFRNETPDRFMNPDRFMPGRDRALFLSLGVLKGWLDIVASSMVAANLLC